MDSGVHENDLYGFRVCTTADWASYVKEVNAYSFPLSLYIDSDLITSYEKKEDYLSKFHTYPISEAEVETLARIFHGKGPRLFHWGVWPNIHD